MRALNAQFELFDTSYVPVGNWNGGMQQGSKLAGRESARKYKNSGNEAKKWLKTKGITFFDAANCAHFTRKFAPIERCMEQKRRVLSKTKLRLRRGQARQESDRKSATSPADLAASVPTAPPGSGRSAVECGRAGYSLSPGIGRRRLCCRTPRRRQRASV